MFVSLVTKPIKKGGHVNTVTGHNHRTDPTMSNTADPAKSCLNQHLVNTAFRMGKNPPEKPHTVLEAINHRMGEAKVKRPKNSEAVAQELVLSASPEYFRPTYHRDDPEGWGKYDEDRMEKWKEKTMEWLNDRFGEENIVDAVLHLDEATPHIHAIVLPIVEVGIKKRRTKDEMEEFEKKTPKEKEAIELQREKDAKKVLKWNRSKVFGRAQHYEMQEEYGKALEELNLVRGIPKKFSKAQHKELKDYHRERFQSLLEKEEILSPDLSFKVDTRIEGFRLPEPKMLESAKSYKERCGETINDLVEREIGDDYEFKINEFKEAFENVKEFANSLYEELMEEKRRNEKLKEIVNEMVEFTSDVYKNEKNKIKVKKLIQDFIKQKDPEDLVNPPENEVPSQRVETENKPVKIPKTLQHSPSQ